MLQTFTNEEIYNLGNQLSKVFENENNEHYFSAKLNFLIQKNKKAIIDAAVEIEKVRLSIVSKYGKEGEQGVYIPQEHIETVNAELRELLSITQEINIYKISFEDLEGVQFTPAQTQALMFMINDPEEEKENDIETL